ncbi:ATP-binding protein [bacterium]|nr:MAG: ATP-binding protein [bacterium]
MKRFAEKELISWKADPYRKPLILNGARQVGKTSLLKHFGQNHFKNTAYFNFEQEPQLAELFEKTKDANRIFEQLSIITGKEIQKRETLIVLDEIQECIPALSFLKYVQEQANEFVVVAAGSLLGVSMGKMSTFPVGKVDFISLYPIQFAEFLAFYKPKLFSFIEAFDFKEKLPELLFSQIQEVFVLYSQFGGMPEILEFYSSTLDAEKAEHMLRNLLATYAMDFSKHADTKDIPRIHLIWESLPSQLAKENKKFLYQYVKEGARAREFEDALNWLNRSGLVHKVYLNKSPRLPLSAYDELSTFKIYGLDIGLIRSLARLPRRSFLEPHQLFMEFKGSLAENYVLQSLVAQGFDSPRYWTSNGKAELDFIIQNGEKIIPIEVKSGINVRSRSLSEYQKIYEPEKAIRFSLQNIQHQENLVNIPIFLADWLKRVI